MQFTRQDPRVINVDKNQRLLKAVEELKEKKELSEQVELRQTKYLNNIAGAGPQIYEPIPLIGKCGNLLLI